MGPVQTLQGLFVPQSLFSYIESRFECFIHKADTLGTPPSAGEELDYLGSKLEVTAGFASANLSSTPNAPLRTNANIELGCSISMIPHIEAVSQLQANHTLVKLANHLVVKATHRGAVEAKVPTLVVPSLAEPLLSVAGLCNVGLTAVFTTKPSNIYCSSNVIVSGAPVGQGYRKGNLYYLLYI
jgi:hypothetical protein